MRLAPNFTAIATPKELRRQPRMRAPCGRGSKSRSGFDVRRGAREATSASPMVSLPRIAQQCCVQEARKEFAPKRYGCSAA